MRRALASGTLGPALLVDDQDGTTALVVKLITTVGEDDVEAFHAALADAVAESVAHPGLLSVLATRVDPAGVYLVSPYVEGPTLESSLRGGRQPLARVLEWLAAPAAALHLAHQQGRRHGAIHPRDILLPRGRGVLTGLDISPTLESLGLQAPVRVPFTAPERASGKAWDARADQYSLAMIALDALSGRRLIAGTIPAFDRWSLADTPAEDARLHEAFGRALHPDPDQRFDSVAAWLEALAGASDPGSELSRFARHGVIPAAAKDARRGASPETGDDAKPLALFPDEDESSATVEAPVTPSVSRTGGDAGRPLTQSPTGEWLVASMPDDQPPLADTGPLPIQSVTPLEDPRESLASPVREADDDFTFRDAGTGDRGDDVDLGPAVPWADEADLSDVPSRRGGFVLAVALIVVALMAFGTWRSLRGPAPGAGAPAAPVADVQASADQEPSSPAAPAVVEDAPLRPSAEELAAGAPPPTVSPSPPSASSPIVEPPAAVAAGPAAEPDVVASAGDPGVAPAPSSTTPAAEAPLSLDLARILIRSSPAGEVRVNGQPAGRTPVVLRNQPFGSYVITISSPGYRDAVEEVDVLPSQPVASISVDLERVTAGGGAPPASASPRPPASAPAGPPVVVPGPGSTSGVGSLYVVSSPADGRLFIDGQPFGTAPAVVPGVRAGRHVIRVEMPGYRPFERTVDVQPGQRVRVDATLLQEPR